MAGLENRCVERLSTSTFLPSVGWDAMTEREGVVGNGEGGNVDCVDCEWVSWLPLAALALCSGNAAL